MPDGVVYTVQMKFAAPVALVLLVGCSGPVSGQPPKASPGDSISALVDNPSRPYRWVSPPPGFEQSNQAPGAGETQIPLTNGESESARAFTDDGQVTVSFSAGTFIAPPRDTSVRIRITPVKPQPPSPTDVVVDGNAYSIDAVYLPSGAGSAALQLPILLSLRFAGHLPDAIYRIDGTVWTPIGGTLQQRLLTVEARSSRLGTFAAADRLAATTGRPSFNGTPLLLGGLVLIG
jgi:hypothetical protein